MGVGVSSASDAIVEHWTKAASACHDLCAKLAVMRERCWEIGCTQGESIMNGAQCIASVLRYCVEPKLLHLLQASAPVALEGHVALVDK
eukprot:399047-Karenia_brevis.AAC.1